MGSTTDLRRALKTSYFPELFELGFHMDQRQAPNFIDFRRRKDDRVEFISIQWEKSGRPRFKLSFGATSSVGTFAHGKHVPPEDVDPGSAPSYCCIYPTGDGSSTRHWFRQDRPLYQRILGRGRLRPTEEVLADLRRLQPQVEEYFQTGTIGSNCRMTTNAWAANAA
jgi:hypothetical protein